VSTEERLCYFCEKPIAVREIRGGSGVSGSADWEVVLEAGIAIQPALIGYDCAGMSLAHEACAVAKGKEEAERGAQTEARQRAIRACPHPAWENDVCTACGGRRFTEVR
jgi:hypothetical protein